MKKISSILSLALCLWGCGSPASEKNDVKIASDQQLNAPIEKLNEKAEAVDKTKYDQTFLDGLSDYHEPYKLIDNFIIIGQDTLFFPEDLPINQKTTFKGAKENKTFLLNVTRNNLTNLTYSFELIDKDNKIIDSKSGKAVLGPMFFLASEMDEDSETGDGYGSSEYWDNSNNCSFSVRIGIGLDDNGKQRAMVTYSCKDNNKLSLELEECPTLRTQ